MRVSKRYRMLFTAEKYIKFCRSDTLKTIHDDDAFRYVSRDVTCHRLWRHNYFSNSIQFELIYFISIWTLQNLFKIRSFLCIIKRNEPFDHPSYLFTMCVKSLDRWEFFFSFFCFSFSENLKLLVFCDEEPHSKGKMAVTKSMLKRLLVRSLLPWKHRRIKRNRKWSFFIIFPQFSIIVGVLIKVSISHHPWTNSKILLLFKLNVILICEIKCFSPWVISKYPKMI